MCVTRWKERGVTALSSTEPLCGVRTSFLQSVHSQRDRQRGLVLCSHHPKILITFEGGEEVSLHFHFALGAANYVAVLHGLGKQQRRAGLGSQLILNTV